MPNSYLYPRPEYPRPDRQRGAIEGKDWLNLNGPWQFRFDPDGRGLNENWFLPDDQTWREQIIVPFCWESLAAWREGDSAGNENYYATRVFRNPLDVTRANHRSAARYEIGWYRRLIEIPGTQDWRDKRIILTVGAADFFTDGWCNGRHLGHHEGGYTPFEFDLTDALTLSEDGRRFGLIVLRVEDPMDNHEQPVGKQWRWYTPTSGIWQTVFVEPRAYAFIDSFRITPNIDESTAHFAISCERTAGHTITVRATAPNGASLPPAVLEINNGLAQGRIHIDPLFLWSPDRPDLYRCEILLTLGDQVVDRVRSYFGMRKIDFSPMSDPGGVSRLRLNGVAGYLRGALYQSFYPEGVYTAADVDTLKRDIQCAKTFGFNFLRIHIKVDDPLFLYYADTMGILLMADFPNFGEGGDTPLGRSRFEEMMRQTIKRDFNHPSIIAWCMFNETWGFGGQLDLVERIHPVRQPEPVETLEYDQDAWSPGPTLGNPTVMQSSAAVAVEALKQSEIQPSIRKVSNLPALVWVQKMWELAKKLDPTRLVEDMSVCHWEHLDYYAHGNTDINSWHFYIHDYDRARAHIEKVVSSTYPGSTFNYVDGYKQAEQPLINSEYGGIGALDGDRDVSWSFKFLTNELRRHDKISAYIYTELHDVEWEYNGFLNYDRTPKEFGYEPALINASDVLIIDSPPAARVQLGAIARVPVFSSHFSDQPSAGVTLIWRLGGVDTLGRLHQDLQSGAVPIPFPHRTVAPAHEIPLQLPHTPMLCTLNVQAVTADGVTIARNYIQFHVADNYPALREQSPRLLVLRQLPHQWREAEWTGRMRLRQRAQSEDACFGHGSGFFEWAFELGDVNLEGLRRLRVLCETSSRRQDTPQTDDDHFPTTLQVMLNNVRVHKAVVANHPHDSRGVLSYLRGGRGAYGYLINATVEGDLLQKVLKDCGTGDLILRFAVPPDAAVQGGLTVYGAECGRYPICPTIVLEW